MVPTSPEGSKGSYPSQHYPQDADGASSTKDVSSETEGWSSAIGSLNSWVSKRQTALHLILTGLGNEKNRT